MYDQVREKFFLLNIRSQTSLVDPQQSINPVNNPDEEISIECLQKKTTVEVLMNLDSIWVERWISKVLHKEPQGTPTQLNAR